MNTDTLEGKWDQVKGKAKQQWAKLGDTDLMLLAEGKTQEFAGKIQEAYGKSKEEAEREIREFHSHCGCSYNGNKAA